VIPAAREAAVQTAYARLTSGVSAEQAAEIEAVVVAVDPASDAPGTAHEPGFRARLEPFKTVARKASPESRLTRLDQLSDRRLMGVTALPARADVPPATRWLLAGWGYRDHVWHLRRLSAPNRHALVLGFLQAARAEMTDRIIERQDKLITSIHHQARKR